MNKMNMYDFKEFCYVSNFIKFRYITTELERQNFNEHLIANIEFTQVSFSPYLPMILFRSNENRMQINGVKEVLVNKDASDSYVLTFVCWYGDNDLNKRTYTFQALKNADM